ncbi:MAG: hypothetical protein WBN13_12365 [Robiginitalea sp.]|uniref:hypothetical protein n=1 Tax=Robiginitalea sp. TaxID=1902411 RepID=UPI003C7546AB
MKFLKILLVLVLLVTFQSGYAQLGKIIPKPDLIKTLADTADLGFSKDKNDKLIKQNESFVNDLFGIVDSDKSEDDKKSALQRLKKDNNSKLDDLLGIDGANKYRKKMKKTLRPYKRKMKLLKFAL